MLDEVHLYLAQGVQHTKLKSGNDNEILFSDIVKAEIYKKDVGKTLASWIIPGLGIPVVTVVIIGIIAVSNMHITL